jgi:uncharacterized protein YecT (DUF1311 family)
LTHKAVPLHHVNKPTASSFRRLIRGAVAAAVVFGLGAYLGHYFSERNVASPEAQAASFKAAGRAGDERLKITQEEIAKALKDKGVEYARLAAQLQTGQAADKATIQGRQDPPEQKEKPPAKEFGQGTGQDGACSNAQSTAAMRECEIARLKAAEAGMNAAYKSLSAKLDQRGREKLRSSQQAWLEFRDAEADYQADAERGGTLAPLIAETVKADLTEARRRELEKAAREVK